MNEQKLKLVLKQLTTLCNLQAEKNKNVDFRMYNLQEQIKSIEKAIIRLEIKNARKE